MTTHHTASRHYLIALTAFALPALGLLLVRSLLPAARPGMVHAETNAPTAQSQAPQPVPAATDTDKVLLRSFTEAERAAPARLALGIGTGATETTARGTPRPSRDLPTGVALTSVMKTPGGAVAVILGKLYRVGDRLTPEWTVSAIDDKLRTATLTHADGERRVLAIESK